MVLYRFDHWEDETGETVGTSPTLTYTVGSDKTFRAVYSIVIIMRNITYESSPINVQASVNGNPVNPGETLQVEDGAQVVITVPAEVEA
ncbi:hypothetical protein ES702_00363 [subsurface metagenome]